MSVPNVGRAGMRSDNPTGAGDQQERSGIEQWIVGFVDGEVASASRSSGPGLQARVAGAAPLRGRAGPAERGGPVDDPAVLRLWRSAGTGGTTTERTCSPTGSLGSRTSGTGSCVLRTGSTGHGEGRWVHEVRGGHPDDGGQVPPLGGGPRSDRGGRPDHEPSEAVSVPGILRGHTPASSPPTGELKIWSRPYGDIGIIGAKFLVG